MSYIKPIIPAEPDTSEWRVYRDELDLLQNGTPRFETWPREGAEYHAMLAPPVDWRATHAHAKETADAHVAE